MTEALAYSGVSLNSRTLVALQRLALASSRTPAIANLPGGFLTRKRGQGVEIADVREYVAGDDIRHLDRGTTARTGRLHVRRFQEERDRVCLLVADFRSPMFWGLKRAFLSVAAAEALVLLGWQAVQQGGRVGVLAITTDEPVIVPIRGKTRGMVDAIGGLVRAHQMSLDRLKSAPPEDEPTLEQALSQARRLTPSGAEILIASGFDGPGSGLEDQLNQLAHRRNPRLFLISESKTHEMPRGQYPIKMADGRFRHLYLSRGSVSESSDLKQIAGHSALVLNASDPVEITARQLSGTQDERIAG